MNKTEEFVTNTSVFDLKSHNKEANMEKLEVLIWCRSYNPFIMGGHCHRNISTKITIPKDSVINHKGFKFFEYKGKVFELNSGGYCGDSISDVIADIDFCDDIIFMKKQIEDMTKEREGAEIVSYDKFFVC